MKPRVQSVTLPSGVTLQYVEQGDPAGIPALLLHGFTDSWRSFERVLPHLSRSVHAFALTQRGHGDSDRPLKGYRTRDFAADAADFATAVGLARVVVVGHSMGGANAMRFAIDYPERTLGLMPVGAFASIGRNAAVLEFWEDGVSKLSDPIDPTFVREFQGNTLARPVPPEYLDAVIAESLKVPARVWRAALEGAMQDDFTTELGRVRAPTQIVWGELDRYCTRDDQAALLRAIPGARLTVYAGGGHALHWEQPARFAADLASFAEGLFESQLESARHAHP